MAWSRWAFLHANHGVRTSSTHSTMYVGCAPSAVKTDVLKLAVRRGSPERQIATFYSRQTTPSLLDESKLSAHQSKIKLTPNAQFRVPFLVHALSCELIYYRYHLQIGNEGGLTAMTSDAIYNDLYGISPGAVAAIMGFFTLLTPYGILPSWWALGYPFPYPETNILYSLFWAFGLYAGKAGLHNYVVYNPALLWTTLPLSLCNVIFALKVVRYYQDRTSKDSVLRWAFAAFIVPILAMFFQGATWTLIGFLFDPAMAFGTGFHPYFGPIPIQIAVGLFIVCRIRAPELVTPWTDPERDESWWIEEEIEEFYVGKLFITMEELDEIYQIWE